MNKNIQEIITNYQAQPFGIKYRAAVLIPLIQIDQEWHVLYQVRSKSVSQPGETSFPGGKIEVDESPQEAALRETMEELCLEKQHVEIFGEIDYLISSGTMIHCFVGHIKDIPIENIQPNSEVDRLFTVPLTYFFENKPTYHQLKNNVDCEQNKEFPFHLVPNGKDYPFSILREHKIPFYHLQNESLWGYTANLTDRFIQIIEENR